MHGWVLCSGSRVSKVRDQFAGVDSNPDLPKLLQFRVKLNLKKSGKGGGENQSHVKCVCGIRGLGAN